MENAECTNEEWKRELKKQVNDRMKKFALSNLLYGLIIGFCAGVFVVTNFGWFQ